jgi:hypothetical protein
MSTIRKRARTYKTAREKRKKVESKIPIADLLLFLGIMAIPIGAILGIIEYDIYINGRPEHIVSTREGTMYKPAVPPGEPGRRASAIAGFYIAGSGLILMLFSLIIYEISVSKKDSKKQQSSLDSHHTLR